MSMLENGFEEDASGNVHIPKEDPRATGNGTYSQGCYICGSVAPTAAHQQITRCWMTDGTKKELVRRR